MEVGMKVRIVGRLKQWDTGQKIQPHIVNAEITVLAPAPKVYTVSAIAENGTVEGAGLYEEGTQATLTATASEGYEFVNWTVDGTEVSTENPYTFNVTANVEVVANFKEIGPSTDIENAIVAEQPVKIVRNGQVFILKGNKMFNTMGQQVK
jgi:uncharacterized repeat protein (TIGR02543 family)